MSELMDSLEKDLKKHNADKLFKALVKEFIKQNKKEKLKKEIQCAEDGNSNGWSGLQVTINLGKYLRTIGVDTSIDEDYYMGIEQNVKPQLNTLYVSSIVQNGDEAESYCEQYRIISEMIILYQAEYVSVLFTIDFAKFLLENAPAYNGGGKNE